MLIIKSTQAYFFFKPVQIFKLAHVLCVSRDVLVENPVFKHFQCCVFLFCFVFVFFRFSVQIDRISIAKIIAPKIKDSAKVRA